MINTSNLTYTEKALLAPQTQSVLAYLRQKGSITQRDAIMDLSVQSLTRRITDLNQSGLVEVTGEFRSHPTTGQRYKVYSLVEKTDKQSRRRGRYSK